MKVVKTTENSKLWKVGDPAIAASYHARETCPDDCPLMNNGCYAERGNVRFWWAKSATIPWGDLKEAVEDGRFFRFAVTGDLPGTGRSIDKANTIMMFEMVHNSRAAWGYSHKCKTPDQVSDLKMINGVIKGCVNASADNLVEADRLHGLGLPTVVTYDGETKRTMAGVKVVRCPAETGKTTCASCGSGKPFCARKKREFIVGFKLKGKKK